MERLRPSRELGLQAIIPEKDIPEFFKSIRVVGLDMDDTTVRHDPRDLFWKFTEAVIHAKAPERITPGRYVSVVDDPHTEEAKAYGKELANHAEVVFGKLSHEFFQSVSRWVAGTVDRSERTRVVENDLGFSSEETFWDAYNAFGQIVPRTPQQYLRFTPGAREFLQFLFMHRKEHGLQIHLISNSKRGRLENYVAFIQQELGEGFDGVTSARDDAGAKKPDPACMQLVTARINLSPNEQGILPAIYVGNGDEDVLAATAAGWTPIIINPHQKNFAEVTDPHFRFRTMRHLHTHWQNHIAS